MSEQPTCNINEFGQKYWLLHGELHREDGPAIEWYNGDKGWYLYGKVHRKDGPAMECVNGDKQWWYHGENLTDTMNCHSQQMFERLIKLKVFW
jgi:hypothetical protein